MIKENLSFQIFYLNHPIIMYSMLNLGFFFGGWGKKNQKTKAFTVLSFQCLFINISDCKFFLEYYSSEQVCNSSLILHFNIFHIIHL